MIVINSESGAFTNDDAVEAYNLAFDEACEAFKANGWTWSGSAPTVDDINARMLTLMEEARQSAARSVDGYGVVSGGRLRAEARRTGDGSHMVVSMFVCYMLG